MKYDIQALQIFQEVLESIKEGGSYCQLGLCMELQHADFTRFAELQTWMHGKYMPDKRLGAYWWPVDECHEDEELEQAQKDRITFLERIIEDLMCGE
jgi:hypothetical protein